MSIDEQPVAGETAAQFAPSVSGMAEQEPRNPPRKGLLGRAMTRDIPRPPFAGRKLGRGEVEQILAVTRETGRQGAIDLRGVDLRDADLSRLNLAGARLGDDDPLATDGERRDLAAQMDRANLAGTNLAGAIAPGVGFAEANLQAAQLVHANCAGARFAGASLAEANLTGAQLTDADLTGANLAGAQLAGAVLVGAHMQKTFLRGAHLESADLGLTNLMGADLRHAYCNDQTHLGGAYLRHVAIEGLHLRDLDLTAIDWSPVKRLGDELAADAEASNAQAPAYRAAARVYRRLGLALRGQGMSA
ncbi:MAG TPA: pentapeptide repeat-containing protein, partial [Ktedonobacterales bacterium]|nr:pentapeptide repeat-containing protein [Ktedonobacterales bacterium]